jgi:hypothetical protein
MRKSFHSFQTAALVALTASSLWLAGCITLPPQIKADIQAPDPAEPNAYARASSATDAAFPLPAATRDKPRTIDAQALPLESGQIVVRDDGDVISLFVSLFAQAYVPWSHVGLVSVENGETVIYDMTFLVLPIPGIAPTRTSSGGIRRVTLEAFADGQQVVGVYAPPPEVDVVKMLAFARHHYEQETPFDPYFDSSDTKQLYCSEFIALALEAGGSGPQRQIAMRNNRSYALVRDWMNVRATHLFLPGQFADPARQVALWSPHLTPAQIEAFFEIRRELTRRFDEHTRLGHLFRWTGNLHLRADPRRFMEAALAAVKSFTGDAESVRQTVRRMADDFFVSSPRTPRAVATQPATVPLSK